MIHPVVFFYYYFELSFNCFLVTFKLFSSKRQVIQELSQGLEHFFSIPLLLVRLKARAARAETRLGCTSRKIEVILSSNIDQWKRAAREDTRITMKY